MISRQENELLTQSGPGTPCGELLRRYWQPVALAEELPHGAPLRVTILNEELVLFRDDQGRPGLVGRHCSHRGTDLSYGRVENGGLRCLYHGWLYDVCGRVLEQPGEPAGGTQRERIRHRAYPCREAGGVIFTYMGPGEPPLLPDYEFLTVPEAQRSVTKIVYRCNFLQGNEGNIDPVHLSFLHQFLSGARAPQKRIVKGSDATDNSLLGQDMAPTLEIELTGYGLRIYSLRAAGDATTYLRVTNFIMPNLAAFGGSTVGEGYSVHWHVPIDDLQHWKYVFTFSRERPLSAELRDKSRAELDADYRLTRNSANRYGQDRGLMTSETFTGMGYNFQAHDAFATESQGAVQDRTAEHLVSSDKAIVAARKLLLVAMDDVKAGRDPRHVVRRAGDDPSVQVQVFSEVIPGSLDWREYTRERIARIQQARQSESPSQNR